MSLLGHLANTVFHTFFRLLLTALICALVGAGVVLGLAYFWANQWPPQQLTIIAAIAAAALLAYAGATTVLMTASAHALLDTVRYAKKETFTTGNIIESGLKAANHLGD